MDIIGTIIACTLGIILWVLLVWFVFTVGIGGMLVVAGILLAAWIVADWVFDIT